MSVSQGGDVFRPLRKSALPNHGKPPYARRGGCVHAGVPTKPDRGEKFQNLSNVPDQGAMNLEKENTALETWEHVARWQCTCTKKFQGMYIIWKKYPTGEVYTFLPFSAEGMSA